VTPIECVGDYATFVSRIREDATVENGLNLWVRVGQSAQRRCAQHGADCRSGDQSRTDETGPCSLPRRKAAVDFALPCCGTLPCTSGWRRQVVTLPRSRRRHCPRHLRAVRIFASRTCCICLDRRRHFRPSLPAVKQRRSARPLFRNAGLWRLIACSLLIPKV
jgi:hypothetical protein